MSLYKDSHVHGVCWPGVYTNQISSACRSVVCANQECVLLANTHHNSDVGQTITVVYTAPSVQHTTVNLEDDDGGIMLHVQYRISWGAWTDTIMAVSNKPASGSWGTQTTVRDFHFTPGSSLAIRVKAKEGMFSIIANGKEFATYEGNPSDVTQVCFSTTGDSKLKQIDITYF